MAPDGLLDLRELLAQPSHFQLARLLPQIELARHELLDPLADAGFLLGVLRLPGLLQQTENLSIQIAILYGQFREARIGRDRRQGRNRSHIQRRGRVRLPGRRGGRVGGHRTW